MSNKRRPNIIYIMSDDHARQAISAYADTQVKTPGIDRLFETGARLDNAYCTNSICTPSRASVLTGNYNQINGVRTLEDQLDGELNNVAKVLQNNGYHTAIVGKWHLGQEEPYLPTGFDHFAVLRDQGPYFDPEFITDEGSVFDKGYTTELITERSLNWIKSLEDDEPFFLMMHHKAPHRNWQPAPQYDGMYKDIKFKHPETYNDDYATRGPNAAAAVMKIEDLKDHDIKGPVPEGLTEQEEKDYKFQRYMEDYWATIKSVDDSVDELLNYLEANGLRDDTIVIYTSDQGFFTGEHGWFDKRFMYEEAQAMPFLISYPRAIQPKSTSDKMVLNIDFAPTFLDYAGIDVSELNPQGRSFRDVIEQRPGARGYDSVYYRYWDYPSEHNVYPHMGVRTNKYKLIFFEYRESEEERDFYWELYDVQEDPNELNNLYGQPGYEKITENLIEELKHLQEVYQDDDPLFEQWVADGPYYWEN